MLSVIVQGRDITQQLEAERMKQEFTSTLSHELRTPLTSIIGSLQLINSGVLGDIDKEVLELTSIAERNGQRLLDLINDILDIEKIESGKLALLCEPMPLDELVTESLTLNRGFAERFKVHLAAAGELPRRQGECRSQAPAAGDDQSALECGEILARGLHGAGSHAGRGRHRAGRRATTAGPAYRRVSATGSSAALRRPTCRTRGRRAAPASAFRSASAWSR